MDSQQINLDLWDTAGSDDYYRLRSLSYPETDVFLVCFNVVDPVSFDYIEQKWCPELDDFCPDVPRILVCTQVDLRDDEVTIKRINEGRFYMRTRAPIPRVEGEAMQKKIGAVAYMECSALRKVGIKDVFDTAARIGLQCMSCTYKFVARMPIVELYIILYIRLCTLN